jgi:hypothetical protein
MADYSPVYAGGVLPFTSTAASAIVGGTPVVAVAAGTVGPAGATSALCVGIAGNDAATGAKVTVWPLANVVHEVAVVAAGTVTALDGVVTGALATVQTAPTSIATQAAAGALIGIALTTATAPAKVRFIGRF